MMYVEGWRRKVEQNGNLNYRQSAADRVIDDPVVTVALRSDGTVESVTIDRSSGSAHLDAAIRRIVEVYAPYSAFPPDMAREVDVLEIRRVWSFGTTLRILEEVR